MACLSIERIYFYLERELPDLERKKIRSHLNSCPKCCEAVKERKFLLRAVNNLPQFTPPPNFTENVLSRIYPAKVTALNVITALSIGFLSLVFMFAGLVIIAGKDLLDQLQIFGASSLEFAIDVFLFLIKSIKVLFLLFKIIFDALEYIPKGLAFLTTLIGPEIQAILICLVVLTFIGSLIGTQKKLLSGGKA